MNMHFSGTARSRARGLACGVALALGLAAAGPARAQQQGELGQYNIDTTQMSVSGISSGAHMAHQVHIAHSADLMGAALLAGGPYRCADIHLASIDPLSRAATAMIRCTRFAAISGEKFGIQIDPKWYPELEAINALAEQEFTRPFRRVDDRSHLCNDRVYLLSGGKDTIVPTAVMDVTHDFYRGLVDCEGLGADKDSIDYVVRAPYPHAVITDPDKASGGICVEGNPYITDCDYDSVGALLQHIYGPLKEGEPVDDRLIRFNQWDVIGRFNPKWLMHEYGHVYVPAACAEGEACRLHIAIHGCAQNEDLIKQGYLFARDAGYNGWAEANNIVVLYPQVDASRERGNPFGCWDWWGYNGDPGYHTKHGGQVRNLWTLVTHAAGI